LLQHLIPEAHLITQLFCKLLLVLVPPTNFLNLRQRNCPSSCHPGLYSWPRNLHFSFVFR